MSALEFLFWFAFVSCLGSAVGAFALFRPEPPPEKEADQEGGTFTGDPPVDVKFQLLEGGRSEASALEEDESGRQRLQR